MTQLTRLALLSAFFTGCAPYLPESATPAERARAELDSMVRTHEVPGIQYVVVDATRTRFEAAAGVRDAATGQPLRRSTLQMAYSVTKVVTAIAVLQLVERGKIDLEGPLSAYYRAHPYGERVTIRSLLAQTSGVPNPLPLRWFAVEGQALDSDAELGQLLEEHAELAHSPGAEYTYSNLSYWLLEKAIERASGLDYAAYVAAHVFEPLGIRGDQAGFALLPAERMATGHGRRFGPTNLFLRVLSPAEYWLDSSGCFSRTSRVIPYGRGYGGLFANASALGTVLQDLLRENPTLLSAQTRALMFSRQHTSAGEALPVSLGWVIGELDGARYYGKQGGGLGFHGNVRLYPDQGIATVFLSNQTEISPGPIDARSDELDRFFVEPRG